MIEYVEVLRHLYTWTFLLSPICYVCYWLIAHWPTWFSPSYVCVVPSCFVVTKLSRVSQQCAVCLVVLVHWCVMWDGVFTGSGAVKNWTMDVSAHKLSRGHGTWRWPQRSNETWQPKLCVDLFWFNASSDATVTQKGVGLRRTPEWLCQPRSVPGATDPEGDHNAPHVSWQLELCVDSLDTPWSVSTCNQTESRVNNTFQSRWKNTGYRDTTPFSCTGTQGW